MTDYIYCIARRVIYKPTIWIVTSTLLARDAKSIQKRGDMLCYPTCIEKRRWRGVENNKVYGILIRQRNGTIDSGMVQQAAQ